MTIPVVALQISVQTGVFSRATLPRSDMTTNRRSPRVLARIPVTLTAGQAPPVAALTAVVNRQGALLLSALPYDVGAVLRLQNELTLTATDCRVVWVGEADPSGAHKLGVEFVDADPTFWGTVYEDRVALDSRHTTASCETP